MIRLVVCDLDGTLLPYGQDGVSKEVKNAISALLKAGTVFAVSSGRTYKELLSFLPEFSESIYFICCDGAYCVYKGKTVYARKIENSDLQLLFKAADRGISCVFHGAEKSYSIGDVPAMVQNVGCTRIKALSEIKERIFKVTAFGGEIRLPAYCGLRTHWDGGENKSSQLVNRYCDKGAALSDLQVRLMLTKFDTACVGDSGNDVPMMKGAKYSFCVGERCEELARVCGFKVSDAVEALEYIIENK